MSKSKILGIWTSNPKRFSFAIFAEYSAVLEMIRIGLTLHPEQAKRSWLALERHSAVIQDSYHLPHIFLPLQRVPHSPQYPLHQVTHRQLSMSLLTVLWRRVDMSHMRHQLSHIRLTHLGCTRPDLQSPITFPLQTSRIRAVMQPTRLTILGDIAAIRLLPCIPSTSTPTLLSRLRPIS
jgi:hypothetical protein